MILLVTNEWHKHNSNEWPPNYYNDLKIYRLSTIMQRLALLIPTTSRGRECWVTVEDTYLYNLTFSTYLQTQEVDIITTFYIGTDDEDKVWNEDNKEKFKNILQNNNINCIFVSMQNIEVGYVTKMWNKLFEVSYNDHNDYFYQCGDDINFTTKHWISDSIQQLKLNNDIGLSGPKNNNHHILTQGMVSRKHMLIFGYFFPEEIRNHYCDDWYNLVYKPNHLFKMEQHYCSNDGGTPRYKFSKKANAINAIKKVLNTIVRRDKQKLNEYIRSVK